MGDPRVGVCDLPPAMIDLVDSHFVLQETVRTSNQSNTLSANPPSFAFARYPVTNAQFAMFIADDGYNIQRPWWDEAGIAKLLLSKEREPEFWKDERLGNSRTNHPVVGVTWYEATAFCRWLTQNQKYNPEGYIYQLPSEIEWVYAAHGLERRDYPWGVEEPNDEKANFGKTYNGTTPVGCFMPGMTPEGIFDMAGNVWEWTSSFHLPNQCILRGGSWDYPSSLLNVSGRIYYRLDISRPRIGFRLVRHSRIELQDR
jgi:formylglycine-generating enzyme required for sulfatase activity